MMLGHNVGPLDLLYVGLPLCLLYKQIFSDYKKPQYLWDAEWVKHSVAQRVAWEESVGWNTETMMADVPIKERDWKNKWMTH